MSAVSMMRNTCTIKRPTASQSSSSAGMKQTWANAATGVRCSIQARSSSESFATGMTHAGASYIGYFPAGTDIRNKDRIGSITGQNIGGLSGKTLEVRGLAIDQAGRGALLAVPLEEVKDG